MHIIRTVTLAAVVILSAVVAPEGRGRAAQPQMREDITVKAIYPEFEAEYLLTFSSPVALPGVSLSGGTYLFRRVEGGIIQVLHPNRRLSYVMVQTIPTMRESATDAHVFVLGVPGAANAPRRLKKWFLPGNAVGQEFLYPTEGMKRATE